MKGAEHQQFCRAFVPVNGQEPHPMLATRAAPGRELGCEPLLDLLIFLLECLEFNLLKIESADDGNCSS
jgi:hypothetical protein